MKRSIFAHYLEVKGIGLNNVPSKGPILIAATHPNSFLDAIIIAVLIKRPLYFLARSDVFKAKWADRILRSMNLIPIYRLQEGVKNLNRNDETFKECYSILDKGGAILIFAEGVSEIDKKIRPLKKGLARIAFGFAQLSEFKKDCKIVPLSLNYDRPTAFRSKVLIGVSPAIGLKQFQSVYEENNNQGILSLNELIFKELKSHTIEVEEEHDLVYHAITNLDSGFTENSLSRKIMIANQISQASKNSREGFDQLKKDSLAVSQILDQFKLNFRKLKINKGISLKTIMALIFLSPLALIGLILNSIPYLIAKRIADKKVKLVEFYSSVRLVIGTIIWLLLALIISLIGLKYSLLFLFSIVPLYGFLKFYLWYYEKFKYFKSSISLKKLKQNKELYEELQGRVKNIYRLRKQLNLTLKDRTKEA